MRDGDLTYDDFLQRLNIQDVLIDAGYHLNRRDGLRYPSYVRLDSDGRRIRGDKFIVTQQGKCCFHAQQQKDEETDERCTRDRSTADQRRVSDEQTDERQRNRHTSDAQPMHEQIWTSGQVSNG